MFFNKIRFLFSIAVVACSIAASSQDHIDLINQGERDFNKISEAFYTYWNRSGQNQSDLKKFKRWEYRVQQQLVNGLIPSFEQEQILNNSYKKEQALKAQLRIDPDGNWETMGPDAWEAGPNGYAPGNGRINAVAVDPNNPSKIFVGAASGGVWKSEDGGESWTTNTDYLNYLGVTDIYINPNNSNEIWVLTGDADSSDAPCIGLLYSDDGGDSWTIKGLQPASGERVYYRRLIVSQDDVNNILVCSSSGISLSKNGGITWNRVLSSDISDIIAHPTNPNILYAVNRVEFANGSVTAYKSTDKGATWETKQFNIPELDIRLGRKVLAVSPNAEDVLYILAINADNASYGGVFRSSDQLKTLEKKSSAPNILSGSMSASDDKGQGWYDLAIAVSPTNIDEVYVGGINVWKSISGGKSWSIVSHWVYNPDGSLGYTHADIHSLDFYHDELFVGSDGGVFKSSDYGKTFENLSRGLEIGQFYRIGIHPSDPQTIVGGLQDNGSFYRKDQGWYQIYGADGMEALIDFENPSRIFTSYQFGGIMKHFAEGFGGSQRLSFPDEEEGAWVTPYIMDASDHNTLYFGLKNLYKTTDSGNTFEKINTFSLSGLFSIVKQNPSYANQLIAGDNSKLYLSNDRGGTWNNISNQLASIIGGGITDVAFSPNNPDIIYATVGNYLETKKVLKTENQGLSWVDISNGLPAIPVKSIIALNDCNNTLFVGTEIGVYSKSDLEDQWELYGSGLPNVSVSEMEYQQTTNRLFIATYGRGIWSIPLQLYDQSGIQLSELPSVTLLEGSVDFTDYLVSSEPVQFSTTSGLISIDNNIATLRNSGIALIKAEQEGTCPLYFPLTINRTAQTIVFETIADFKETDWEFPLSATSSANLPVRFYSENLKIASIEDNIGIINGVGTTNIVAQQNGNEFYLPAEEVSRVINIYPDNNAKIGAYPNPVSGDELYIHIPKNKAEEVFVTLIDTKGRKLIQDFVPVTKQDITMNIANLPNGIYVLKIGGKSFSIIRRR